MPLPHPLSTVFILIVLGIMALLIRRKVPVIWVLVAALVAIMLLYLVSPVRYVRLLFTWGDEGSFLKRAAGLLPLIYLINLLGMLMRGTGREKELVHGLEAMIGHRGLMAASTSSAMGLLPMPGGALLSANMVGMSLQQEDDNGLKAAINLWFRHIWETVSPLYPGIILSAQILKVPLGSLAWWNLAMLWAILLSGSLLLLKRVTDVPRSGAYTAGKGLLTTIRVLAPIILAITVTVAGNLELENWCGYLTGPLPGVGMGVLLALVLWRPERKMVRRTLLRAFEPGMLGVLVLSLMIATAVEMSGAVEGIRGDLEHYNVPAILIVALLPFLTGFLSGLTTGYVSMTMPLVAGFTMQWGYDTLFTLAYMSGFLGVLYSPVHLCVVLSAKRFNVDYGPIYRRLIPPGLLVVAILIIQTVIRMLTY